MAKNEYIKDNYNDYIIGIDLSLTDSGVSVYSLSKKEIVFTDNCNTDQVRNLKKYRGYNRNSIKLNIIREFFEDIKKRFPPRIVIFERGFAKFRREVAVLNQVNGVAFSVFWNYSQVLYAPTTVKKEIVHGKAEKEVVRDVLLLNIPELRKNEDFYNNDNISDAVAVLYTYLLKEKIIPKSQWDKGQFPKSIPKKRKVIKKNKIN